ncbi:MAG: zinc-dependent metalloprotease [Bacteroidales bacterium]
MRQSIILLLALLVSPLLHGQLKSIEEFTRDMEKQPGFFTYYLDNTAGKVWLEIDNTGTEFLYVSSITAGLGSNDVGLDRNRLGGTKIVYFERTGPEIFMVQPNYRFRAHSDNPDEVKAVRDAFARSVIHGFDIAAESDGHVLVDITAMLTADLNNVSATLQRSGQGDYRIDGSRSSIFPDNTKSFPDNTDFESVITFASSSSGRYVRSVSPDASSVTLRQHLSFIRLPDNDYSPRTWDPRSGYGSMSYMDFSAPIDQELTKRFIRRHRLKKKNPAARISDPVEPIIYYVDRGTPEPIRSALIEGASWWNEAFEAAGYRDAFRVEVLPEGADPMDIRYNMINWIHRSTRGWSYGSSVTDPRTGEIIKGHIALGSQRIRQDFLIAAGLIAEYEEGKDIDPAIKEMALLRVKQLSCHEVGHTLGLNHNYASSATGRSSVMDYPHPLVRITNGSLDLSDAYTEGTGEWDKVSIAYGYSDFPDKTDEKAALNDILDSAFKSGLIYLTDQDAGDAHPQTHVWDNGTDPVDELKRVMEIRSIALDNFSEKKVPVGAPLSTLEDILVPVYLFHRYQITAASSVIGGVYYNHKLRGDTQELPRRVPAREQYEALETLLEVIEPASLAIDKSILDIIPPRTPGYQQDRELFDGHTGLVFDPFGAAENIVSLTADGLLKPERASRIIYFHSMDPDMPSLDEVLQIILASTVYRTHHKGYHAALQQVVNDVIVNRFIQLAAGTRASGQAKAMAHMKLMELKEWIEDSMPFTDSNRNAHYLYLHERIDYYSRYPDRVEIPEEMDIPAGAPIGSAGK